MSHGKCRLNVTNFPWDFGQVKELAGGTTGKAINPDDLGKPISIESIEEMPSYVTIVTDLAQVAWTKTTSKRTR